MNKEDGI